MVVVKEMELNSDKRTLDVYYIKQGADRLLKLETLKFSSISSVAHTFSLKMSGIIAGELSITTENIYAILIIHY